MRYSVILTILVGVCCIVACDKVEKKKKPLVLESAEPKPQKKVIKLDSTDLALKAKVDSFFSKRAAKKRFNGTVLIARKGKVVYKEAFGYANFKTKDTLTTHAAFQLASVSKPITALAIMKLVESGKISLEDTVSKYIACFGYKGITIKHLLSHRSGLPEYFYFTDQLWQDKNIPESNEDVICMMEDHHPKEYWEAGKRYDYCNTNFCLLGAIVEHVTGMEYGQYVEDSVFAVLGMEDSFIYNEHRYPEKKKRGVTGHHYNGRPFGNFYQNGVVGDKNVFSSVEDLFILDQALYTEKLLQKSTLDTMFKAHNPELRAYDNYGLGWRIDEKTIPGHKIVYHAGWWKGFKTYFFRILNNEATIIVLTNRLKGASFSKNQLLQLIGY